MEVVLSDLVRALLSKRGVPESETQAFLSPDYLAHTHSPELILGMENATARLLAAIAQNEKIAIYADFDCDGIPGAALMHDFFARIGHTNVETYLPHRDREGYGFHEAAIEELAKRGVTLVITIDVGTSAVDAVAFARERGVEVIVTDHHEITGALPEAIAVLNPKLGAYPFRDLCGAAMAFKLVQATLAEGRKQGIEAFCAIPAGWEKWLLDLVAIATIADMVPLVGENRALAHWGLQVLRKSPRPGLGALVRKVRLRRAELTEDDIGFSLAPRINAASRMDDPDLAFRLLTTRDPVEAEALAAKLEELNTKRKTSVGVIVREAKKKAKRFVSGERVAVLGDPDWKPSLLGLAANSIVQERGGVAILWGRDALGRLKGSARSDGSISVVDLFAAARDSFEEFGGHAASGGFTVSAERVHTLQEALSAAAATLEARPSEDVRSHDAILSLDEISWPLFQDISRLAPFGTGNPKPVFKFAARIIEVKTFGKEKNHIEVRLESARSGSMRAFDFFRAADDFTIPPAPGLSAAILSTIERDAFRGGLSLRLVDIIAA